jgi:SHS2 domain-containing protein
MRSHAKDIKAVTYHHLEVRDTARGMETRIVFDV